MSLQGYEVLIIDDWMETAAQTDAATTLVEHAGGKIAGIAVLDGEQNERSRAIAAEYDSTLSSQKRACNSRPAPFLEVLPLRF